MKENERTCVPKTKGVLFTNQNVHQTNMELTI